MAGLFTKLGDHCTFDSRLSDGRGCDCVQGGWGGLSATHLDSPAQNSLCNFRCWQLFPVQILDWCRGLTAYSFVFNLDSFSRMNVSISAALARTRSHCS